MLERLPLSGILQARHWTSGVIASGDLLLWSSVLCVFLLLEGFGVIQDVGCEVWAQMVGHYI